MRSATRCLWMLLVFVPGCSSSAENSRAPDEPTGGKGGAELLGGGGAPNIGGSAASDGGTPASGSAGGAGPGGNPGMGGASSGGESQNASSGGSLDTGGAMNAGGSGGDNEIALGTPCVWDPSSNPCGTGKVCRSLDCVSGECGEAPGILTQLSTKDLVCGCDGVTYWNSTLAKKRGVYGYTSGECPTQGAVTCDLSTPCTAANAHCNLQVDDPVQCSDSVTGTCWVLPNPCSPFASKGINCAATSHTCESECSLIQQEVSWYKPTSVSCD